MEPFQARRPGAQVKGKRPATEDDFRFGEEAIAFLAAPRACGAWRQVAGRGEGGPRFANFVIIPSPGVSQLDSRINSLNLRSILCADALNAQDIDSLHGRFPNLHPNISLQYSVMPACS
jgi:hypothetical protein